MNTLNTPGHSFCYWILPNSLIKESALEKSGTYAACEQMIQMPCMRMQLSKLDEMLVRLEKNGRLSSQEHQRLLKHARQVWHVAS